MKKIQATQKIIGESFFGTLPKSPILLESDFVRLDRSIIWKFSDMFWRYFSLWEKTYKENFEASLPSGISESHKPEFIKESVERFVKLVKKLNAENVLPNVLYIYEQGPGTGVFAKGFLNELQKFSPMIYDQTMYLLSDSSQEILKACAIVLADHTKHTKFYMQNAFEHTEKFREKVLFARHSNLWDGWPCRFVHIRKSGLGEVYVRAVASNIFSTLIHDLRKKDVEYAILHNSRTWKEFFRSIKLQTRTIPFSAIDIEQHEYLKYLHEKSADHAGRNTLLSDDIMSNLTFLSKLIDWKRNGYIEIVDIIASSPRKIYPKKYDGSIGHIIDGGLIKSWCKKMNKDYTFKKIRKLNTLLTITSSSRSLEKMVLGASLEIFPAKNLLNDIQSIQKDTILAVTCTSKLGVGHTIENTIALRQDGHNAYPHLPARLLKNLHEVEKMTKTLVSNTIFDIFVAAGNPSHPMGQYGSAIELLYAMKHVGFPFGNVAVAGYPEGHPYISQDQLLQALQEKQEFAQKNTIDMRIITQFCFSADTIVQWARDMKKKGIMLPIVVGIPGPCNGFKLLEFAIKCGVGNSLQFLQNKKNLGKEISSHAAFEYSPDHLLKKIVKHPLFAETNIVGLHFYTFNNLSRFANWQKHFLNELSVAKE